MSRASRMSSRFYAAEDPITPPGVRRHLDVEPPGSVGLGNWGTFAPSPALEALAQTTKGAKQCEATARVVRAVGLRD